MKKVTITIIILLLVALWTSCSNNLDEKVYSEILDETYQYQTDDFEANIAGAYNPLRSDNQMYYWYVEEQSITATIRSFIIIPGIPPLVSSIIYGTAISRESYCVTML